MNVDRVKVRWDDDGGVWVEIEDWKWMGWGVWWVRVVDGWDGLKKKDEIESDDEVVVVVDERVVVVVVDEIELRKMDFEEIDGESEVFFRDFEMVFFV